jgi:peroxiredoxin Q/BCP
MLKTKLSQGLLLLLLLPASRAVAGEPPAAGQAAPLFQLKTDKGVLFKLAEHKGQWTVLYFYPKDDTPGCTKQACAFRDSIAAIRKLGAEVYGLSQDSVESHQKFIAKHGLTFPLLADVDGSAAKGYGADGMLGYSKRWTFIVGPDLKVRWVQKNVDPALNAKEVAQEISKLQAVH